MQSLTIQFRDEDTTLERLESLAATTDLSVEQLVKRCIDTGLGGHGLRSPDAGELDGVSDRREIFRRVGLTKPIE